MKPFQHLTDDELRQEIGRLSAIESSNRFCGLAGMTVGETLDAAETELELRRQWEEIERAETARRAEENNTMRIGQAVYFVEDGTLYTCHVVKIFSDLLTCRVRFVDGETDGIELSALSATPSDAWRLYAADIRLQIAAELQEIAITRASIGKLKADLKTAKQHIARRAEEMTRDRECLRCRAKWTAPVKFSPHAISISGELATYCPECGSREVMSGPIRSELCTNNEPPQLS